MFSGGPAVRGGGVDRSEERVPHFRLPGLKYVVKQFERRDCAKAQGQVNVLPPIPMMGAVSAESFERSANTKTCQSTVLITA